MADVISSTSSTGTHASPANADAPEASFSCERVGGIVMNNTTCAKWLAKLTKREVSELRPHEIEFAPQEVNHRIERYGFVLKSVGLKFNTLAMLMTQSAPSDIRTLPDDDWFLPNLEQFKEGETERKVRQYLAKIGGSEFVSEQTTMTDH